MQFKFQLKTSGVKIPQDHGYMVHSALSKPFPFLHGRHGLQIAPIRGTRTDEAQPRILLKGFFYLYIRGITNEEADTMLSHEEFILNGVPIQICTYQKEKIVPSPKLSARVVLLDNAVDLITFSQDLKTLLPDGVGANIKRQRAATMKVMKDGTHIVWKGYSVTLTGLTPEQSLAIQTTGLGHGKALGCGVFYPGTL